MRSFSFSNKGPLRSLIIPVLIQQDLEHLEQECLGSLLNEWVLFLQDLHSKNLFLAFITFIKWLEALH